MCVPETSETLVDGPQQGVQNGRGSFEDLIAKGDVAISQISIKLADELVILQTLQRDGTKHLFRGGELVDQDLEGTSAGNVLRDPVNQ